MLSKKWGLHLMEMRFVAKHDVVAFCCFKDVVYFQRGFTFLGKFNQIVFIFWWKRLIYPNSQVELNLGYQYQDSTQVKDLFGQLPCYEEFGISIPS